MVEFVIDSEMIQTLIAAAIPLIAFIVSYVKKKLSNDQGDMAFNQMKMWIQQLSDLTPVFPELKPVIEELTEVVNHAEALWDDPVNNSAELSQIFAHATILYGKAMTLIGSIKTTSAVAEVKV
jgi:hypothetical protein